MVPDGRCEGPFFVAEELAVNEFRGNGRAVYLHEGHHGTLRELVDALGHQFLSGAVGAGDEDAGLGGGHLADHFLEVGHRHGFSHHLPAVDFLFEDFGFLDQIGLVRGILQGDEDAVQVQRLLDEIEGAFLDTVHGRGDIGVAAYHDDGGLDAFLDDFYQHLGAVHLRHLDVAEDGVVLLLLGFLQAFQPVFGRFYLIIFHLQNLLEGVADGALIVYNQNFHVRITLLCKYRKNNLYL